MEVIQVFLDTGFQAFVAIFHHIMVFMPHIVVKCSDVWKNMLPPLSLWLNGWLQKCWGKFSVSYSRLFQVIWPLTVSVDGKRG